MKLHPLTGIFRKCFHRVKLENHSKLTEVGICNNAQLLLIVTTPFELYVQDMNGRQHTIIVPSSEPEVASDFSVYTQMLCESMND